MDRICRFYLAVPRSYVSGGFHNIPFNANHPCGSSSE